MDAAPPKLPCLTHTATLRLINSLNAVICGEQFARVYPISGTINQVNEHRDDFINITDQLSGCVAFPRFR